jgi:hypothetical protein
LDERGVDSGRLTAEDDSVCQRARADFDALSIYQERKGIATYGETLQVENGRDHLTDAMQEVADAFHYLTAAKMRQHRLERELAEARAEWARYRAILDGLRALEWRKERTLAGTFNEFCPVCHGSPSHMKHNPHTRPTNGHRPKCELWALLVTAS